ncbi:adenosylcobinamide-GDP ribazoletransferase, partial [Pseudoroseomonas ludipueritiae]
AALGRGATLGLLRLLPPARPDGVAAGLGRPGHKPLLLGLLLAALPAALLLPPMAAMAAILGTALATLLLARLAGRQIGGQTGDVLGAGAVLGECVALTVLVAMR